MVRHRTSFMFNNANNTWVNACDAEQLDDQCSCLTVFDGVVIGYCVCQSRNIVTLQHPDELVKPLARASGAPKRRLPSKMRRTAHQRDDSSCQRTSS